MPAFDDVKRSRFKMTLIGLAFVFPVLVFTMVEIHYAWRKDAFEITTPWIVLGSLAASAITGISYYVAKETQRRSLMGFIGSFNTPEKKILKNHEDQSDPEKLPF